VRLWDVDTGKELRRFEGYTEGIADVDISPDGRSVVSGTLDGKLRIWQLLE